MAEEKSNWILIDNAIQEIIALQKTNLLKCGRRIIPTLTPEDILQPNDYSELENNPHFRYEEGILSGMQTIQMAIQSIRNNQA